MKAYLWSAQHQLLYWTDIHGRTVWTWDPETSEAQPIRVPVASAAWPTGLAGHGTRLLPASTTDLPCSTC